MQALTHRSRSQQASLLKIVLLVAAFLSFLLSVYLYFIEEDTSAGIFVGIWVPSIHSLGALLLAGERSRL